MNRAQQIERIAAEWLVKHNRGLHLAEAAQCEKWLKADPAHAAAFHDLQAAWAAISYPDATGKSAVAVRRLAALERQRHGRRIRLWRTVGAAAAILVSGLSVLQWRSHRQTAESSIVISLPGHQILPDGSKVELNRDARIEVRFSPARREVKLLSGQALFTVARNRARPFVVAAEGVEIRAVGTEFAVNCAAREIDVTVTEGRVALERNQLDQAPPLLSAGQQALISSAALPAGTPAEAIQIHGLSASELTAALAWRLGQVKFNRTPLSDAVKVFNRGQGAPIVIHDAEVARLPLTGTLQVGEPEAFVRLLEQGFGLEAVLTGAAIELRRRDAR